MPGIPLKSSIIRYTGRKDIMKTILSLAGFDASSGAGVTRDVDTFFSFGFHGIAVPTCTVIQGPQGVVNARGSSGVLFRDTLKEATRGVDIKGIKIGFLGYGGVKNFIASSSQAGTTSRSAWLILEDIHRLKPF